jgi:Arc/MetJ-type ribon-helix-helix transcriptional regulator
MIRTQIQLPEHEYEELRQAAARERRSMADCIREGIRWFLGRRRGADEELAAIAGKFRPLPLDDLKPHDRWHVEGIEATETRRAK